MSNTIEIRNARQNNLKSVDIDIPVNQFTVVSGASGSGKSSLVFDVLYAEGQRRYIETFSPYARQFLDRMDKPDADVKHVLPAIALQQVNPVKTSRSTVGTMTEIADYLKVLYARAATLYCSSCNKAVTRDVPHTITDSIIAEHTDKPIIIAFPVHRQEGSLESLNAVLVQQGLFRIIQNEAIIDIRSQEPDDDETLYVVIDRITAIQANRSRMTDSAATAFRFGHGTMTIHYDGYMQSFSEHLHCAECDIEYSEPDINLFSFNSPVGACPLCHGFGRIIDIDPERVVPDKRLSISQGAIRPWKSKSKKTREIRDLVEFCNRRGISMDKPFNQLSAKARNILFEGDNHYYGIRGYFRWLETKAYRMHVRVMLSRYRMYITCPECHNTRFQPETLNYRYHDLTIADVNALPLRDSYTFFKKRSQEPHGPAAAILIEEIKHRLEYLIHVGLGYLSLNRQSRTLSGGEVERVHLTTALGSSLVNTLYILDEPSIGLHPRDTDRLIDVLHNLRDRGNTVVVVEHEPDIIRAADNIIDIGPGAGEQGGRIICAGSPKTIIQETSSKTGQYLNGSGAIAVPEKRRSHDTPCIEVKGACGHNLKNIDITIPLHCLTAITGVSGSGKSTLINDTLFLWYQRMEGIQADAPLECAGINGLDMVDSVTMVDQSPVSRTSRGNPVTYVKAFDPIRKLFADTALAKKRKYTPGTFSFNSGKGRCDYCQGRGHEVIEMQFLSDVMLPCPQCGGDRYKKEVLDVTLNGLSIKDVLQLTVDQACDYFIETRAVKGLQPLADVGLGYIRLGQPLPTLSGGEAQRLKLAAHLRTRGRSQRLFLLDEPTTGLHPVDIKVLLEVFNRLIDKGDTIVIIEHNLDIIKNADYIIDLGPEGGDQGGTVIGTGTPEQISRLKQSHTGLHLQRALKTAEAKPETARAALTSISAADHAIHINGAREHNLRNIDVRIPRDQLVAVTGISGSGKSSLVFDILFAEGQRRYMDSVSAYARQYLNQLARPEIDSITGLPPAVAIEQRVSRGGRKSTVGTVTEISHFLRLLFTRAGTQYCPDCDIAIAPQTPDQIINRIVKQFKRQRITITAPLIIARKGFHKDIIRQAEKNGIATLRIDGQFMPVKPLPKLSRFQEHTVEAVIAEVRTSAVPEVRAAIMNALDLGNGMLSAVGTSKEIMYSTHRACPGCGESFPDPDPRLFSFNSPIGACPDCRGYGTRSRDDRSACPACNGSRLNQQARAVRIGKTAISDISSLTVPAARQWLQNLKLPKAYLPIAAPIQKEADERLHFLEQVGISYLTLGRSADTLSTGEGQRIRLAAQLGSHLRGVCYILDEPTIGLHARDNQMLIKTMRKLTDQGNTVVVVEHDEDTIRNADHILDLGPQAGLRGGRLIAQGTLTDIMRVPESLTGTYLKTPIQHPLRETRRTKTKGKNLVIKGATCNNIKNRTVSIPLGLIVCVTGVSGSGKSTLVRDIVYTNTVNGIRTPGSKPVYARSVEGLEHIQRVIEVDQSPIGRTPRSNPATYVGLYTDIRKLFAQTPDARIRGFSPSRFSFNVKGGRCENCGGQGRIKVEMNFLPDVYSPCTTCRGARFNPETLAIEYKGLNISQVLELSISKASVFFKDIPRLHRQLSMLNDCGLGYLTLGQASPTLSGGEAQRIKLVSELVKQGRGHTLYILEEPTTGLHTADIERLLLVLQALADRGNSILIIEHNLDVIAEADYIIDMGPEGGRDGGRIIAKGTPEALSDRNDKSYTARFLSEHLKKGSRAHDSDSGK